MQEDTTTSEVAKQSKGKRMAVSFASVILSLGLVALVVWAIWTALGSLSSQVAATVIVGVITASASVLAVIKSKQAEQRRDIENELRKQKAPIYEDFSSFLFRILMATKTGKEVTEEEMLEFVVDFNRKLIVWGADSVVKEWSNFKSLSEGNYPPVMSLIGIERILYAIRADMGHSNKGMRQGDLLQIFINDAHTFLNEQNTPRISE